MLVNVSVLYIANYDGTDIARPYLVDNSTGIPVYTYLDEDYPPPSNRSRRGATSLADRLWPKGIVYYSIDTNYTGLWHSYNNRLIIILSYCLDSEKEKILNGMRHWEEKTCIRFHPRWNGSGGVLFYRGSG